MEALKQEDFYRQLFDTMNEGLAVAEIIFGPKGEPQDFRVLHVNKAMERLSGGRLTVAGTIGKRAREIEPDYESYWLDMFSRVVATGQPLARVDYVVALDGWYDTRAFSLGEGKFAYLYQDVTFQKRAERILSESEQRLRAVLEASPFPAAIFTEDGRILFINQAWTRISGYRPEEIPTVEAWVHLAFGDRPEINQYIQSLAAQETMESQGEHVVNTGDGKQRTWDFYTGPIGKDREGRRLVLVTASDVTDRVRAESALQESEARFRALADNMPPLVWIVDAEGKPLWFNRRWYEFTDSDFDSMQQLGWQTILHPSHSKRVQEKFTRHLQSGQAWEDTFLIRNREGEYRWFLSRASPIHDAQGRITRWFGTNTDVTDQKRAEEEMVKFALLVEASTDFIALADREGRCTFLNSGGRALVGLEAGEEAGKNIREFFSEDFYKAKPDPIDAALAGNGWQGEGPLRHFKSGKAIPMLGNLFMVRSPETGTPFALAVVCKDMTLIREKEEQLRQSQKMDAIGKLAGGVAHDFNNLLTAINGYCDMLLESVSTQDPKREFLEEIRKSGQKAASLTSQLLAYSRKQVLQPKLIDLNAIVEENARLVKRLIGENIEVHLKLGLDLMAIKADPNQIHQILLNLCLNARDAMPNGGRLSVETSNLKLETELATRLANLNPGVYVVLEVKDTGVGMTTEVQEKLFEPFFTTKELGKGTGLGLSSVYGILQQSGWGLQFESQPGSGAAFRIYLPGIRGQARPEEENALAEVARPQPAQGSILLVEDEDAVRLFTRTLLEAQGYKVLEASDGASALVLLESPEVLPDLILTDVMMPKLGGFQFAEAVKQTRPDIPIMFMSGYTEENLTPQGHTEMGRYFLQKPFSPKLLSKKVEEILASRAKTNS